MYHMHPDIQKSIERIVGLPINEIQTLTTAQERHHVNKYHSTPLHFSSRKRRGIYGRGNPLLAKKRYRTIEYVDRRINEIVKNCK